MDNKEQNEFRYTYSAREREELEKIREKYTVREESKMERLRRLDRSVTQKGMILSLCIGILGALIMGFGMSLALTELSAILGDNSQYAMLIGIIIGVFGMILAAIAYPIYQLVTRAEKARIAPEILRLTDELMK